MVAPILAVVATVTVPSVSIVATIVIIAIAIFKCLATLFTPVIRLTSVVAAVAVVEMTFAYRAAPVVVIAVRGLRAGSARKSKKPTQRGGGQRCLTEQRLPETMQLHTSSLGAFLVLVGVVCVLHTEPEARANVAVPNCAQNRTVSNTTEQPLEEPWREARRRNARKKKGAVFATPRLKSHSRLWDLLGRMFAIIPIVIVIIPVTVRAPTVTVFIPPATIAGVAILAGFVELTASLVGLAAVATMVFNGFMETMIGPGNALLAIVVGAQTRSASEEQKSRQCSSDQRDFSCSKNSRLKFCLHPILSSILNEA